MVEETIKAIRETEAAADVIVKEAGEKSQKILEDARQEAERMIKSQEETHRISAQDAMQDAREKEYQKLLLELTDKLSIVNSVNDKLDNLCANFDKKT